MTPAPAILTTFDAGYVRSGLVANWLESVTRVGLRAQVVLYPMDPEAAAYANATGCETIELWPDRKTASESLTAYNHADFCELSLRKFDAIRDQLGKGRTVLFSDTDIVFFRDPLPQIASYEEEIVTQSDVAPFARLSKPRSFPPKRFQKRRKFHSTLCSGFLRALPSAATLHAFDTSRPGSRDFAHDQALLHHRLVWRDEATWTLLPTDTFPNGATLAFARWQRGDERALEGAVLVHVNWCVGNRKVELLKELGCWYVSD